MGDADVEDFAALLGDPASHLRGLLGLAADLAAQEDFAGALQGSGATVRGAG